MKPASLSCLWTLKVFYFFLYLQWHFWGCVIDNRIPFLILEAKGGLLIANTKFPHKKKHAIKAPFLLFF